MGPKDQFNEVFEQFCHPQKISPPEALWHVRRGAIFGIDYNCGKEKIKHFVFLRSSNWVD
jgi:hypothetical protein